jgi:predicted metal-binding membrane protein
MGDAPGAGAATRRRLILVAPLTISARVGHTCWLATIRHVVDDVARFPPSIGHFAFMLAMWVVMMIGMMTPSVAPTVHVRRLRAPGRRAAGVRRGRLVHGGLSTGLSTFALLATLLQWWLDR